MVHSLPSTYGATLFGGHATSPSSFKMKSHCFVLDIIEFNFGSYYYFLLFCFLMKRHFREIILTVRLIMLSLLKCIHALLTVSWVLGKKEFRLNSKAQIKQAVWVTKQTRLKSFCIRLSALFRHSVKR